MTNDFWQARKDFLTHLHYTKGYSRGTCYAYHSDLGMWGAWLAQTGKDWCEVTHVEAERFAATEFEPSRLARS